MSFLITLRSLAREDDTRPLPEVLGLLNGFLLESELMATLRRDVPLGEGPLVLPLSVAAVERLQGLFERLEFTRLLRRVRGRTRRFAGFRDVTPLILTWQGNWCASLALSRTSWIVSAANHG